MNRGDAGSGAASGFEDVDGEGSAGVDDDLAVKIRAAASNFSGNVEDGRVGNAEPEDACVKRGVLPANNWAG